MFLKSEAEEILNALKLMQILPPPITRTDFEKVLARQRPTVSKTDLEVHEKFTKEFGEEG
jgi:vacuolar protein-sorting-associated protein 4